MTNTPMTFEEWFEQWRASTWKPLPSDARQDLPRHWAMNAQNHMSIAWNASQAQQAQTIADLVKALKDARQTIRAWHGPMDWDIYDTQSPEMKRLNGAIDKVKGK